MNGLRTRLLNSLTVATDKIDEADKGLFNVTNHVFKGILFQAKHRAANTQRNRSFYDPVKLNRNEVFSTTTRRSPNSFECNNLPRQKRASSRWSIRQSF